MQTPRPQEWFEMAEIWARSLDRAAWIPLKEEKSYVRAGSWGHAGFVEEHARLAVLAVPLAERTEAQALQWDDVISTHATRGCIDEGGYVPAHLYRDTERGITAERLVLERAGSTFEPPEWVLNHDLFVTLDLRCEGNVWRSISRGYEDVVRAEVGVDGQPAGLSIQPLYLKDYLRAREMALLVASFRSRTEVVEDAAHIGWPKGELEINRDRTRWGGTVRAIHEGGMP